MSGASPSALLPGAVPACASCMPPGCCGSSWAAPAGGASAPAGPVARTSCTMPGSRLPAATPAAPEAPVLSHCRPCYNAFLISACSRVIPGQVRQDVWVISIVRCDRMSGVVAENIRPDFVRGLARSVFPHGAGQVVLIRLEQRAGTGVATCGLGLVDDASGRVPICPGRALPALPVWQGSTPCLRSASCQHRPGTSGGTNGAITRPASFLTTRLSRRQGFPRLPCPRPCVG